MQARLLAQLTHQRPQRRDRSIVIEPAVRLDGNALDSRFHLGLDKPACSSYPVIAGRKLAAAGIDTPRLARARNLLRADFDVKGTTDAIELRADKPAPRRRISR
jgi:hypothetical protein